MSAAAAGGAREPGQATACPLCGGPAGRSFVASDLNRGASEESFRYDRCRACGTYFLDAPPVDLSPYYPQTYYNLASAGELDRLAGSEQSNIRRLLDHVQPGRLVEIGPGEGVFSRAARNAGFEVTAIEMDSRACEYLREVVGIEAINSALPEEVLPTLPPSRAIVMWHVIEHLRRPWATIESLASNLEPGGVLVIASPNPRAAQFRLLGRRWAHVDAPRHLFLIPAETLARRCGELGLRLVSTTTADPAGRHWNRFGWEYALRRPPRSRPGGRAAIALSAVLARLLRPIEEGRERGCAYTSIFVKTSAT
jgi:SAM-dependent methyltransferase